jgi:broad specificity phosphatase PhoE
MGFFRRLPIEHPEALVAVVGHKGVLEVFLSETIGFDPAVDWFDVAGASVTTFEMKKDRNTKFLSMNVRPGRGPL